MELHGFWNKYNPGCRLRPTALAIVISTLTGEDVTPQMTAAFAMGNGEYVPVREPATASFQCGETLGFIRGTGQTGADGLRGSEAAKRQSGSCNLRREHDFREQRPLYCTDWNTADGYLTIADPEVGHGQGTFTVRRPFSHMPVT